MRREKRTNELLLEMKRHRAVCMYALWICLCHFLGFRFALEMSFCRRAVCESSSSIDERETSWKETRDS